jgi:hypothetical protein
MSVALYEQLNDEVEARKSEETSGTRDDLTKMVNIYRGELPPEYEKFFPRSRPKHIVNLIRLAWDDLATTIGRLPELRGDPLNASDAEMKRVGKLEHIGYHYLRWSKPSGKMFLWQLAWWLLGGRGIAMVIPDLERQIPVFTIRDPRHAYPNAAEVVGGQITELNDILFQYELDKRKAVGMGLCRGEGEMKGKVKIVEYIDRWQWVIASEDGTYRRTWHGLGEVPAWVFQAFSPDPQDWLSQFNDQVTFMVAISMLLSQKLAHGERLIWPITWVRGHEGTLKIGPNVINKLGENGEMGQISPPGTFQVDQDIATLERFSRILNRNPEVRQGEVQSKGAYVSAKTLEQLTEAIDTVVGRHWDTISVGLQRLFMVAYRMDETLWPEEEKSLHLNVRGRRINDKYVPLKDINGRYYINVDYGFGVGGYQGFLQHMQAMDAKLMSRVRTIESMPGVTDVDAELRQMEIESMDEAGMAMFQNLAAMGELDMVLWAKLRKEMAAKGTPLHEIITKYAEMIAEAAQQAQASGASEPMTNPPPPEEAPPMEEPLPAGIPPSALVGV